MPTNLCDRLGIDIPLIAFSHCRDVVAAVGRAGGLGVLGGASMSAEQLEEDLVWLDEHSPGRPYGVDLLFPATTAGSSPDDLVQQIPERHRDFVEVLQERLGIPPRRGASGSTTLGGMPTEMDHLITHANARASWSVAKQHPVRLLASALGPPPIDVRREARDLGMLVAGLVGDPRHVRHQLAAEVDLIVAQGFEAAGHTGEVTTMVLVPQVVAAAGDVPVVAAGGIATGAQVVAALALGAQAVWTGSLWLATHESDQHPSVKAKIVGSTSKDTRLTRSYTGKPSRQLRTSWTEAWAGEDAPPILASPVQQLLARDAVVSAFEHEVDAVMGTAAGQGISLITAQRTVAAVIDTLRIEMVEAVDQINRLVQ